MFAKRKRKIIIVLLISFTMVIGFNLYSIFLKEKNLEHKEKRNMIAMYLEDESGEYKLSSSKEFPKEGYVLNLEKSTCTNGGVLSQDSETKLISLRTSNSSKCDLYFEKEKVVVATDTLLAKVNDASITNYTDGNTNEMYTFTHPATTQTEALTDYRYIGANPNNWIKFNDEDWRIIGVFTVETESKGKQQLIKIIRNETIGEIPWDDYTDASIINEWSTASLKSLLNGNYYSSAESFRYTYKRDSSTAATTITVPKGLNATAKSQIESAKWYLGGSTLYKNLKGSDFYTLERGTNVYSGHTTNIIQKVGLMYPSDYVYTYANGVDEKCYTDGYNCKVGQGGNPSSGWLYNSSNQWTQTPGANNLNTGTPNSSFAAYSDGSVYGYYVSSNPMSIRPTVYLKSDIKITGGDGSQENAYTIE